VLDEGDEAVVDATIHLVAEVCADAASADPAHVDHWLERRNDVAALEALISRGYVVDTMEVAGRWRDLPAIYDATIAALSGVEGSVAASAHQSHSYPDGTGWASTAAASSRRRWGPPTRCWCARRPPSIPTGS
jgi:alkyldihydroxyacetonephosphate synthase